MKTVLIAGEVPVPPPLRELIERGSTTFEEQPASALEQAATIEADRIVFWTGGADAAITRLAERYAKAESAARRETIVFVSAQPISARGAGGLPATEVYVWPRDEDRLKMAFLTGG